MIIVIHFNKDINNNCDNVNVYICFNDVYMCEYNIFILN